MNKNKIMKTSWHMAWNLKIVSSLFSVVLDFQLSQSSASSDDVLRECRNLAR